MTDDELKLRAATVVKEWTVMRDAIRANPKDQTDSTVDSIVAAILVVALQSIG
jgi:hypothetical protein